jgi:hypothetical protein
MNDAAQYMPVIDPACTRLVPGKARLDRSPLPVVQPELVGHVMLPFISRQSHSGDQSKK